VPDAPRDALRDRCDAKLFAAAGLKPDDFRRCAPHYRPPVYADDLWGLEEAAGTGKWADVAVCGGRVVYFRVGEPFDATEGRKDRAQGENVEAQGQRRLAGGFVTIAIALFAVAAAGPFAYRNWRLGRADLTGALRVVGLYAVCNTLTWLFLTDHVWSLHVERVLLTNSLGVTSFWGGVLFVCYLAIEPYMRRRWPERLSSWNRLLSGKFRDPLVGRDVLVGLIAGVCVALPAKLAAPALGTYYLLAPVYDPLTPNVPPGLLFALASFALIRTTGAFVLLLLLGSVFRRELVAVLFVVVAMTAGSVQSVATFPERPGPAWGAMLVVSGMIAVTIVRFGWIATFVALFASSVLNIMPLTLAPEAWYATATLIAAAALVALGVYGCVVSVGEQRFLAPDA
jgi:serine/threonine-protein kinase